jgi:predicted DNA-binding protein
MAKLKRTLILRITEDQFRYILNSSIKEEKSKSKIIREAIEKHRTNGKN